MVGVVDIVQLLDMNDRKSSAAAVQAVYLLRGMGAPRENKDSDEDNHSEQGR